MTLNCVLSSISILVCLVRDFGCNSQLTQFLTDLPYIFLVCPVVRVHADDFSIGVRCVRVRSCGCDLSRATQSTFLRGELDVCPHFVNLQCRYKDQPFATVLSCLRISAALSFSVQPVCTCHFGRLFVQRS